MKGRLIRLKTEMVTDKGVIKGEPDDDFIIEKRLEMNSETDKLENNYRIILS